MQQIAFSFTSNDKYNFNEFIESDSNKLAYSAISNWKNFWGVDPYPKVLIIRGPKDSGKTFLAKQWVEDTRALQIDKKNSINELIIDNENFFLIEDLDSSWDEEKFLHIFNLLAEKRKYLLITCRFLPKTNLADLSSRLKSVNLVTIQPPDDKMMQMLIFKLFSNYSIVVGKNIVSFLIRILPREFPIIFESIQRINHFALENKQKITISTIKKALNLDSKI